MKYKLINENFTKDYGKRLLAERGVYDIEEFLQPTIKSLNEPFLLDNMREGIDLLERHIAERSDILIVVDSDADGMTSSSILYQYIKRHYPGASVDYWLHSAKQHGLEDHIKELCSGHYKYKLVITPDAGSNDYEYHERLKEEDIEVLVLDHHHAEPPFSDNAVIINNQLSPNYPNKALTGAGVTLQFCRAWDTIKGTDYAMDYVDLAAVGIVADMSSVIEPENRYIFSIGLKYPTKNYFLNTIYEKQAYSLTRESRPHPDTLSAAITPIGIGWYVAPLINALIRAGSPAEKQNLFLAFINGTQLVPCNKRGAKGTLEKVAIESLRECTNARTRQNKAKERMMENMEIRLFNENLLDNKIILIELDEEHDYPPELNGLVANQLMRKYEKPVLIVRRNNEGFLRGSARGPDDVDMESFKDYLSSTGLFEYVEGHDFAFGVSLPGAKLDEFVALSNDDLKEFNFEEVFYKVNFIRDAEDNDLEDLILDLCQYDRLWGKGNPAPLILVENIKLQAKDLKIRGGGTTIAFSVGNIDYVCFGANELAKTLESKSPYERLDIEVIGNPTLNEWAGHSIPQIKIVDLNIKEDLSF